MCGQMMVDTKLRSAKGTGSIMIYKVYSRILDCYDAALEGRDHRFTVISKLNDPDAYGAERVALYNCNPDQETIANWEAGRVGKEQVPFTFTGRQWLDTIAA